MKLCLFSCILFVFLLMFIGIYLLLLSYINGKFGGIYDSDKFK